MQFKERPNINPRYGWTHESTGSRKAAEDAVRSGKRAGKGVYVEPRKRNGRTVYHIYMVGESPH